MSKEITSKRTGKIQFVTEEEWENIVSRGWDKRFKVRDLPVKKLPKVEMLPPKEVVKDKPPKIK